MKKIFLTVLFILSFGYLGTMAQTTEFSSIDGSQRVEIVCKKMYTGVAIYKLKCGDIYDGEFVNGKPNGQGKYTWADGDVYQGGFINGLQNGYGSAFYADKCNVYEGEWKDEVWSHLNGYSGIDCVEFEFGDNIKFEFNGVRID